MSTRPRFHTPFTSRSVRADLCRLPFSQGAAPFALKGAGLDSTQPKIKVSYHPERSEGSQPRRLPSQFASITSPSFRATRGIPPRSQCLASQPNWLLPSNVTNPLLFAFRGTAIPRCALGVSQFHRRPQVLEGAPSFAVSAKGGLLRSNATYLFFFSLSQTTEAP